MEFLRQYHSLPKSRADSANRGSGYPREFAKMLRTLDPRISECVLQLPSIGRCNDNAASTAKLAMSSIHVFLPFLIDCPIRTTAWEVSTSIRQLAYGLLKSIALKNEQEYCVFEHRRQINASGKGYRLPNIPVSPESCIALISFIDHMQHSFSSLSVPDQWIAFAVCQQVEWSSSASKSVNDNFNLQALITLQDQANNHINCTWDTIQFLAQVQGVFYSLRILQQITGLLISCGFKSSCLGEASILHDRLKSLPPLSDVPSFTYVIALMHKIKDEHMVQAAYDILGIKKQISLEVHKTSKNIRKKRKPENHLA